MSRRISPGKNALPLADWMMEGLIKHGPWIGFEPTRGEKLRQASQKLRDTELAVVAAQTAKTLAVKKVIVADRTLKTWLSKARLVVMLALGQRWSERWIHTGFTDRHTNVPKQLDARISLARSLVSFLARHPEFGVSFADVTAARGRTVHDRVIQSREMLQFMAKDYDETKQQRDEARKALGELVNQLVQCLAERLERSDKRWLDFGFKPTKAKCVRGLGPAGRLALNPVVFVSEQARSSHKSAAA